MILYKIPCCNELSKLEMESDKIININKVKLCYLLLVLSNSGI